MTLLNFSNSNVFFHFSVSLTHPQAAGILMESVTISQEQEMIRLTGNITVLEMILTITDYSLKMAACLDQT